MRPLRAIMAFAGIVRVHRFRTCELRSSSSSRSNCWKCMYRRNCTALVRSTGDVYKPRDQTSKPLNRRQLASHETLSHSWHTLLASGIGPGLLYYIISYDGFSILCHTHIGYMIFLCHMFDSTGNLWWNSSRVSGGSDKHSRAKNGDGGAFGFAQVQKIT